MERKREVEWIEERGLKIQICILKGVEYWI